MYWKKSIYNAVIEIPIEMVLEYYDFLPDFLYIIKDCYEQQFSCN